MSALLLFFLLQDASPAWLFLAEKYDADRDGRIVAAEYTRGADSFAQLDRDGDGVLTPVDFSAAGIAAWREKHRKERVIKGIFMSYFQEDKEPDLRRAELLHKAAAFDQDKDGQMSAKEFATLAKDVPKGRQKEYAPEEAWKQLALALDADGDARVQHAEFGTAFDLLDPERDGLLKQLGRKNQPLPLKPAGKPMALLFGSFT